MDPQDDELARLRAQMDQAREGAKEWASTLWAFFEGLRDEGFKRDEALALTLQFLTESMNGQGDTE